MIGKLTGKIIHRQAPELILDVAGVGYELSAPMSTFYQLTNDEKEVTLWIHTHVREDAFSLFAFFTKTERELFRILIKVNGVGPKLALTILSGIEIQVFISAVQANDSSLLTGIPGVGPKTAQRLILDVKDKIKDWQQEDGARNTGDMLESAHDALVALGYKSQIARRILAKIPAQESCEELIRSALQHMVGEKA